MRSSRWVLLAIVLCCGVGCGKVSSSQVDAERNVATTFLGELQAGRVDPAWQATTVEFKSLMGSDSLRDYVRGRPAFKGTAEFVDSRPIEASKGRLVEYQFRATPPPAKAKSKQPAGPLTIRVMVDFNESPPRVERLSSE